MKEVFFLILITVLGSCSSKQTHEKQIIENKNWIGSWNRNDWQNDATLEILSIKNDTLEFSLTAVSGGHTGQIDGKAFVTNNVANYYMADGSDTCIIEFMLKGDSLISINQKNGNCLTAMGVGYTGNYYNSKLITKKKHNKETEEADKSLYDLGIFSSIKDDSLFRLLTKDNYDLFVNSTQLTSEDEDFDSFNAKVFSSGVRGLYMEMENIIIVDSSKNLWAAVIDDHRVLYFSNHKDYTNKIPKTIEKWRSRFKEYPIIYKSSE